MAESPTTTGTSRDFEDIRAYSLDTSGEAELLAKQTECTFIWSPRSGHPMGVVVNFIHRRDRFWLTASTLRPRVAAIRRDPRVSVAISSKGSGITARQSVTYAGTCLVHDDPETLDWFIPEFCQAMRPDDPAAARSFAEHLRSPGRVVIELVPERRIGFDGNKMWAAAPTAAPGDQS